MTLLSTDPRPLRSRSHTHVALENSQPGPGPFWPWAWMSLACLFLLTFVGVRYWQDGRNQSSKVSTRILFPLSTIPKTLGVWQVPSEAEREDTKLDRAVAEMAGAIGEPLERVYVDKETGATLTVLVIYGPAEKVTGHIPEVCYPGVGYEQTETFEVKPSTAGLRKDVYRSLLFVKKGGSQVVRDEVYYTFRQEGKWTPVVSSNWKSLRNGPPVFKVQIQRRIADRESRSVNNPCEQFLALLLPEIDRQIVSVQQSDGKSLGLPDSGRQ